MDAGPPTPNSETAARRLELDGGSGDLRIFFPYDPELLPVVRSIPGRRWHPEGRYWSVPSAHAAEATERLSSYGFGLSEELSRKLDKTGIEVPAASRSSAPPEPVRSHGLVPDLPVRFEASRELEETSPGAAGGTEGPKTLSVSLLNEWVRGKLLTAFPGSIWVTGEVIGYDRNAHKKHIYFQLAEKVEGDDRPRAVVGAVLFERERRLILRRLEQAPARLTLADGLKIRVRAKVDLYVVTGSYQIVVEEIDPSFTLGDIAQRRERILAEVDKRRLRDRNLSLPFPRPSLRVGLITSFESDAYNDLLNELQSSGFPFEVTLRDVHVQGRFVERDVVAALTDLARDEDRFDVIAIVRGGGSRTDLMAFDSLPIAIAVAEHPVKVLIGVGHHRDQSVLDFIAHSEKTPTAIGKRLVALAQAESDFLGECQRRLLDRAKGVLETARETITAHTQLFARTSQLRLAEARSRLATNAHTLQVRLGESLTSERTRLADRAHRLAHHLQSDLGRRREQLDRVADRLPQLAAQSLETHRERSEVRAARVRAADPARLLERGFAWLVDVDGVSIKSVAQIAPGDRVEARLADGRLRATVDDVEPTE